MMLMRMVIATVMVAIRMVVILGMMLMMTVIYYCKLYKLVFMVK